MIEEQDECPLSSDSMKRSEIHAFVNLHGWDLEKACDLVGMDEEEYNRVAISPQSTINYLPTPDMIAEECKRIRENREPLPDPDFDLRYDD